MLKEAIEMPEGQNPRITLEFLKSGPNDDDLFEAEREKLTKRKLLLGNCSLEDSKMEKNAAYELVPPAGEKYFSCDLLKGALNSGQELIVDLKFTHPKRDPLLENIASLRGIGQWVESVWEIKITGGYIEPGVPDLKTYDLVLRAYVEQI